MESNDRLAILETISQIKAVAENEQEGSTSLEDFLVMPEYSRFRDPDKFLILGGRGSGKTRVFQALTAPEGFAKLIGGQRKLLSPNADNTIIIAGYKLHRDFPSSDILDQFTEDKQARSYWAGSLMILLMNTATLNPQLRDIALQYLDSEDFERFSSLDRLKTPTQWLPYIQQNPEVWENILIRWTNGWIRITNGSLWPMIRWIGSQANILTCFPFYGHFFPSGIPTQIAGNICAVKFFSEMTCIYPRCWHSLMRPNSPVI